MPMITAVLSFTATDEGGAAAAQFGIDTGGMDVLSTMWQRVQNLDTSWADDSSLTPLLKGGRSAMIGDTIDIFWPSGVIQTFGIQPIGFRLIKERCS